MEGTNSGEGQEIDIDPLSCVGFVSVRYQNFLSLTNSPSDTEHLDLLINEQDDILDHLEVAETRYIISILTSHCAEVPCIATSKLGGKSLRCYLSLPTIFCSRHLDAPRCVMFIASSVLTSSQHIYSHQNVLLRLWYVLRFNQPCSFALLPRAITHPLYDLFIEYFRGNDPQHRSPTRSVALFLPT